MTNSVPMPESVPTLEILRVQRIIDAAIVFEGTAYESRLRELLRDMLTEMLLSQSNADAMLRMLDRAPLLTLGRVYERWEPGFA